MITVLNVDEFTKLIDSNVEFEYVNCDISSVYEGVIPSYWWELSDEERENKWMAINCQAELPAFSPENYIPVELSLAVCSYVISKNGYVSMLEHSVTDKPPTALHVWEKLNEIFIDGKKDDFIESYKTDRETLKNKAKWFVNLVVQTDGESNFTRKAIEILDSGYPDIKLLAHIAHKISQDKKGLSIPSSALGLPPSKTIDVPGVFQVRRIKEVFTFHGPKMFYVCADEANRGVCFKVSIEKHYDQNLKEGDLVTIRGAVSEKGHNEKYTKLERVKLLKDG